VCGLTVRAEANVFVTPSTPFECLLCVALLAYCILLFMTPPKVLPVGVSLESGAGLLESLYPIGLWRAFHYLGGSALPLATALHLVMQRRWHRYDRFEQRHRSSRQTQVRQLLDQGDAEYSVLVPVELRDPFSRRPANRETRNKANMGKLKLLLLAPLVILRFLFWYVPRDYLRSRANKKFSMRSRPSTFFFLC
jgi:hypothetical protein